MRPSSGKPQTVSCFLFVLTPVPSAALHSCYKTFKVEIDLATAQQNLEVLRQVVRRQSGNAVHTKKFSQYLFKNAERYGILFSKRIKGGYRGYRSVYVRPDHARK